MTAGVYKITNTKNGKVYIGSAKDIKARWNHHKYDLIHGTHHCEKFQEDFVNHDLEDYTYEILEEYPNYSYYNFDDRNKLLERERYYINLYKDTGLLLNSKINFYNHEEKKNDVNGKKY